MHYIRFLKSPKLGPGKTKVDAKITITTDLGESFLATDVALDVELLFIVGHETIVKKGPLFMWLGNSGMRSLEISCPLTLTVDKFTDLQLRIQPKHSRYKNNFFIDVFDSVRHRITDDDEGSIVSLISLPIKSNPTGGKAGRQFNLKPEGAMTIWEETGDSIARHIWDAGLVLSAYLEFLSHPPTSQTRRNEDHEILNLPRLPALQYILRKKDAKIIELGAGCGIVGITLAKTMSTSSCPILLTDLEDASEILDYNIRNFNESKGSSNSKKLLSHQILDWSSPLPSNVESVQWDMVIISDCTYNPDVVPHLVQTLKALARINRDVVVCLAMKVRHDSELVFFELMEVGGFGVKDKLAVPLPVLGGEDEEIDVYIFGFGG